MPGNGFGFGSIVDRMLAAHASADGWLPAERIATAPRHERAVCFARTVAQLNASSTTVPTAHLTG
jgi:hypothetical protein